MLVTDTRGAGSSGVRPSTATAGVGHRARTTVRAEPADEAVGPRARRSTVDRAAPAPGPGRAAPRRTGFVIGSARAVVR
ncbi:hypothetical protein C8E97_3873 [Saccharothrix australiensis]|uniref:Uncharacterized protein n=1 Tax=Saccharothrix australiensis TaxID=2072 RepID=A0A495W377_9PSEU|nr:hypothetical protein C8E97_3873 [Saccharothrix australiensis]